MNKYEYGNRSEGVVLGTYLDAGFIVSIPFGTGASYDLVVPQRHAPLQDTGQDGLDQ